MANRPEPAWTDLPPAERARRLAAPITIQHHGASQGWGGANINEGRHTPNDRVMARDQWYEPWYVATERD
jgi:hypothetical protein